MLHDSIIVLIRLLQILGGLLVMAFLVLLARNNDHAVDVYLSFFSVTQLYVPTMTIPLWVLLFVTFVLAFGLGLFVYWFYLWQRRVLAPFLKSLQE